MENLKIDQWPRVGRFARTFILRRPRSIEYGESDAYMRMELECREADAASELGRCLLALVKRHGPLDARVSYHQRDASTVSGDEYVLDVEYYAANERQRRLSP